MSRTVIIVGMAKSLKGEKPLNAEIWCVNHAFRHQSNLDRLYFLDPLEYMEGLPTMEHYTERVAAIDVPVFCQTQTREIPQSQRYPLEDVIENAGYDVFACSISYMIAHAIHEGVDKIIMHGIMCNSSAHDYWDQKPNIDTWLGIAIGRGIKVERSGGSTVMLPFPWQVKQYGYQPRNIELKTSMAKAATLLLGIGGKQEWR